MVESISSEFYKIDELETAPSISNEIALQRAMAHMGASSYLWEDEAASNELGYEKPSGELVVLPIFLNDNTNVAKQCVCSKSSLTCLNFHCNLVVVE